MWTLPRWCQIALTSDEHSWCDRNSCLPGFPIFTVDHNNFTIWHPHHRYFTADTLPLIQYECLSVHPLPLPTLPILDTQHHICCFIVSSCWPDAFLANNAETSHSWFPSTKLPAMEAGSSTTPPSSSVDKNCREQLIIYLLDHAVELVNTFGWLWIRFYIASGVVGLIMNEILKPIVIFLARKAYNVNWFSKFDFEYAKLIEDIEHFAGIGS